MISMENNTTNQKQQISTPTAIIAAGFLIMMGILLSKGVIGVSKPKTLSEQVGVTKEAMTACIKDTDTEGVRSSIDKSVENAMSGFPKEERGTPYSIVVGQNGVKSEILGQETYEKTKAIIDDARDGKVAKAYKGNVVLSEPTDHIQGSTNPKVTIIEYSDFECPFCKGFHPVLERIIKENTDVQWIYRHYPLHQHSFEKLIAANCVAKIKGDTAFWKYSDLLFSLIKTAQDDTSDQL